jgi:hypothetical protein
MSAISKPKAYRELIDQLVQVCREGQGQIGAERVRLGVWNANATKEFIPEQHKINLLLERLTPADRKTLAQMLNHEVELGIFETLKALEICDIPPFQGGYEGSPYHDFVGRLAGWEWPEKDD